MDKSELIQRIETERRELEEVAAEFSPEQAEAPVLAGGWSLKSTLAHIEFWERRVSQVYEALRAGLTPEPIYGGLDMDTVNLRVYDESRRRELEEVRHAELEAYQAVRALIEQAAPEELFDNHHFEWTGGNPFSHWIEGNTSEHYQEHTAALRSAILSGALDDTIPTVNGEPALQTPVVEPTDAVEHGHGEPALETPGQPSGAVQRVKGAQVLRPARAFLEAHGRDIDRARFAFHFEGAPLAELLQVLESYQNPDGGFFGLEVDIKAPVSNPFATELALVILRWAGAPADTPILQRTLAYLEETQGEDGTWRFEPEVYDYGLAPWFEGWSWPNLNPSCTLAGLLRQMGLGSARLHERVQMLFDRLSNPRELVDGEFYTTRPYAYFFQAEWSYPLADLYRWGVAWWLVRQHYTNPELDATHFVEYAPMPASAIASRLPAAVLSDQLDRLLEDQQPDGGWPTPYSLDWRPWITVNNLLSLRAYRRI
jgi:hypothetical protein